MTVQEARTRFDAACQEAWEAYRQDCKARAPKSPKRRAVGIKPCSGCMSEKHSHATGGNSMIALQASVYLQKMAPLHAAHAARMEAVRAQLVTDLGAPDYDTALSLSRYWESR